MTKTKTVPKLKHIGSLVTYPDGGGQRSLGYLMCFDGRGVYDAHFGRVEITPENAATHNKLLDVAMLEGLDQNCAVGQGGSFYVGQRDGRTVVSTWCGTLVSDDCRRTGRSLTFRRKGKSFRGRTSEDRDLFSFRRVA